MELITGVDKDLRQDRRELAHINSMLRSAVERAARLRAELDLAEEEFQTWKSQRDLIYSGPPDWRTLLGDDGTGVAGEDGDGQHQETS